MTFIDNIRRVYKDTSILMKIIVVNIFVLLLLRFLALGSMLFNIDASGMLHWVDVSSDLHVLIRRPWTVITFMFSHFDFLPVIFDLLWFYWIGRIFMDFFTSKQLMGLYLLGGWGGMILFLLTFNLLPHFAGINACLMGASASVLAVVIATAVYTPDFKIPLLFLGEISLKWIAAVAVVFTVLGDLSNLGGIIAHIGGILVGVWFALRIRRGRDITRSLNAVIDTFFGLFNGRSWKFFKSGKKKKKNASGDDGKSASRAARPADEVDEEELDTILIKIKKAGYDALTDEEKDKLFKASRRRTV